MYTKGICRHCGKQIRIGISLCKECRDERTFNAAIVSQNKKKLQKLLEDRRLTIERLDRFILYCNNIIQHGKVVMKYNEKDKSTTFGRILNFGKLSCLLISLIIITRFIIMNI